MSGDDDSVDDIFEQMMRAEGMDTLGEDELPDPAPAETKRRALAVIMTPLASAEVLAGLAAMAELDVKVVGTSTGAVAAMEFEPEDEWSLEAITVGVRVPAAAEDAATLLSKATRIDVVLVVVELAEGGEGTTGQMVARTYSGGEAGEDVSPGLILASADPVVEDLLLGATTLADLPDVHETGKLSRLRAARMFLRGMKRKKNEDPDE